MRLTALAILTGLLTTWGLESMLIINEDNDHYFKLPAKLMNEADLKAYIDHLAGTKVTHFFVCPNGQRTSYRSKVHEAIWDPIDGELSDNIWCVNAKILFDKGIDPYTVWMGHCREKGISPWITMRMNDVHFVTTKNYFRNTTFWRDRPDLWRVPNCTSGHWMDYAFDYSKQEVREYHMALVSELLERYDMDGLELDWMRFGRHLTPGKEAEQAPVLTEFVRQVRQLTREWAGKRGHGIGLAVRIPSHPDAAAGLGMDGVEWAKQGLVDILVVSPFFSSADFDIPMALWRERLDDNIDKVRIVPAIDNGTAAYPGSPRTDIDLAMYYGWADTLRRRGAESFYLFNLVYRPQDKPPYRSILDHGLEQETIEANRRRYPLAYRDTVPDGFPTGAQLPRKTDRPASFSIPVGTKPKSGKALVVMGLAELPGVQETAFTVTLNGQTAAGATDVDANRYGGSKTARALSFAFAPDAVRAGDNTVEVTMAAGQVQRIVWLEIELAP